jgi:hypothetical protein
MAFVRIVEGEDGRAYAVDVEVPEDVALSEEQRAQGLLEAKARNRAMHDAFNPQSRENKLTPFPREEAAAKQEDKNNG